MKTGWFVYGVNWWFNPNYPESYSMSDLNDTYNGEYFAKDHIDKQTVIKIADRIIEFGNKILGREIRTVFEAGSGGGWLTSELTSRKIKVLAVEGSEAGYQKTLNRIRNSRSDVFKKDLRLPLNITKKFDLAVCTEVAEHIEPPFSGQLVYSLVSLSDIVWFSFERPLTNLQHYHHPNEQPEKFWINLFRFFNYGVMILPKKITDKIENRGGYIFYRKGIIIPDEIKKYIYREKLQDKNLIKYSKTDQFKIFITGMLLKLSDKTRRLAEKIIY